jgi:hypothetical protein
MSDDDAFQVVERDHDGDYCSKSVWEGGARYAELRSGKITVVDNLDYTRHLREKTPAAKVEPATAGDGYHFAKLVVGNDPVRTMGGNHARD